MNNVEIKAADIFKIPSRNIELVKDFVAKLNNKALKFSLPSIVLNIGDKIVSSWTDENGLEKASVSYPVSVSLPEIKINGYSFLASINHADTGNLVKKSPSFHSFNIPEKYFVITPYCEHCNVNRRRNDTFLLLNYITQEIKQIGRNCLADFLGHDVTNFLRVAEFANMVSSMLECDSEDYHSHSHFDGWAIDFYLAYVALSIRTHGWVPRSNKFDFIPTADNAVMMLEDPKSLKPSFEDMELVGKALAWINAKTDLKNDYLINLKNAVSMGTAVAKNLGFLASLIPAYKKEMGFLEAKKFMESGKPSNFFGKTGDKVELNVRYLRGVSFDTQFGLTWIHFFMDADGNKFKWKTANDLSRINYDNNTCRVYEMGDAIKIKGTIKEHTTHKDVKFTSLTRCKVLDSLAGGLAAAQGAHA
jgi:hypothetical protein